MRFILIKVNNITKALLLSKDGLSAINYDTVPMWLHSDIISYVDTGVDSLNIRLLNNFIEKNRERIFFALPLLSSLDRERLDIIGNAFVYKINDLESFLMVDIDHLFNRELKCILRDIKLSSLF